MQKTEDTHKQLETALDNLLYVKSIVLSLVNPENEHILSELNTIQFGLEEIEAILTKI